MKTTKTIFKAMIMAIGFLIPFSCSESNDEDTKENVISEEEAVLLVENALEEESGGSIETIIELTVVVEISIEGATCGATYQDSISYDYDNNGITASYYGDWSYQLLCDEENSLTSSSFSYEKVASGSTPRVIATGASSMSGTIDGLDSDADSVTLVGNYQGNYEQQLVLSGKNVNSKLTLDLTSLVIDKETDSISSGEGTFTLSGTVDESSFTFNGTISFNADGTASIVIEGETYIILS